MDLVGSALFIASPNPDPNQDRINDAFFITFQLTVQNIKNYDIYGADEKEKSMCSRLALVRIMVTFFVQIF